MAQSATPDDPTQQAAPSGETQTGEPDSLSGLNVRFVHKSDTKPLPDRSAKSEYRLPGSIAEHTPDIKLVSNPLKMHVETLYDYIGDWLGLSPMMEVASVDVEEVSQIYERIDREIAFEEARADRLLRLYGR